jgi:hypothetical protein
VCFSTHALASIDDTLQERLGIRMTILTQQARSRDSLDVTGGS